MAIAQCAVLGWRNNNGVIFLCDFADLHCFTRLSYCPNYNCFEMAKPCCVGADDCNLPIYVSIHIGHNLHNYRRLLGYERVKFNNECSNPLRYISLAWPIRFNSNPMAKP